MVSGEAITISKGMLPALIDSARSSIPTMSAPAALAASAFSPDANTATRTVLPVPAGSTTEPRTTWSDFLGSTPSCTDTSIDSLNLAVAHSLIRATALSKPYDLVRSTLALKALIRLDNLAIIQHLPP